MNGHTFLIWLFHFWVPIRTLTVFSMRPAETTTALSCREAPSATFRINMVSLYGRSVTENGRAWSLDVEMLDNFDGERLIRYRLT